MYFDKIHVLNFKNISDIHIDFSAKVNCFVGDNGVGKTNLLDALYYLSLTKSAFNPIDSQNIKEHTDSFIINAKIEKLNQFHSVACSVKRGEKKVVRVNKQDIEKLSTHIGNYPIILIAPNDNTLINDSSDTRRKYFDSIICQIDQNYLQTLIKYNHALKQRNSLLKQFSDNYHIDQDLLDPYDAILLECGQFIHKTRKQFVQDILPYIVTAYEEISDAKESIFIKYESQLEKDTYTQEFKNAIKRDLILHRTTFGSHHDKYNFELSSKPIKKYGSQGQQKSFLIALKLGQFFITQHKSGFTPVLLLDDIFDKLDENRMKKLLSIVNTDKFGQIFITDARPERTRNILKENNLAASIFTISNGSIIDTEQFEI